MLPIAALRHAIAIPSVQANNPAQSTFHPVPSTVSAWPLAYPFSTDRYSTNGRLASFNTTGPAGLPLRRSPPSVAAVVKMPDSPATLLTGPGTPVGLLFLTKAPEPAQSG